MGEVIMKPFQVKQRFTFGGEKFDIRDSFGNLAYQVEGSFLEIPNTIYRNQFQRWGSLSDY
ncbi:Uncharacterized conserved protein [Streptococcus suis 98HAH33]|nr:Uncharacterized conserved protein [Streptococcus suis 98HAH33]